MTDKINVEEILKKCAIWSKLDVEDQLALKFATKLIAEAIVDKVLENPKLSIVNLDRNGYPKEGTRIADDEYHGYEGYDEDPILVTIDKQSILQVKTLIDYE